MINNKTLEKTIDNPNTGNVLEFVSDQQCSPDEWTNLKRKWAVYSHQDLKQRCKELDTDKYLIHELLGKRALGLVVGHSGLGKSPLLYQVALCVATGKPFLGHSTSSGKVLFLDFENGLGQVSEIVDQLLRHLDIEEAPKNLMLWNLNDAPSGWNSLKLRDMVGDLKPDLVILDSLSAYAPQIEDKNSTANATYQAFRKIIRDFDTSIVSVHHLRKPSNQPFAQAASLEDGNVTEWFHQVRGASALVNGTDIRLGIEVPKKNIPEKEAVLAMGGFGRVRGELPLTYLSRVRDAEGEPLGYERLTGPELLFNEEQVDAFKRLPSKFRFKDGKQIYRKGDQATTDFLKKCISCGILKKVKGGYEKVPE